jgi:hypothetical protein
MGLGKVLQVGLMDMWKCTNQKKMVVNAFGTKLVDKQVMNLQGSTWFKLGKNHNPPPDSIFDSIFRSSP